MTWFHRFDGVKNGIFMFVGSIGWNWNERIAWMGAYNTYFGKSCSEIER
jgi:hypothetical protein